MAVQNWFDEGGDRYQRFRPSYPTTLVRMLGDLTPERVAAVDVGCGNGQLSVALAERFETVFGFDASESQLAHARPHPRVAYRWAQAEALPLEDDVASLLTVAQAVHWFDMTRFGAEAKRVLRPDGIVALIAYGACRLDDVLQEIFQSLYLEALGPYWPPTRDLVDSGYRGLEFPFEEFSAPPLQIRHDWTLERFLGYLDTWSAARRAREAGAGGIMEEYRSRFTDAWGDAAHRTIVWPLHLRLGRV